MLGGFYSLSATLGRAQQSAKLPTIGFLGPGTPAGYKSWVTNFIARLHEHGWDDGRNVTIVYRWAEGRPERSSEIAAEFVRLDVNVIVTTGTEAVTRTKQATSVIPIVFAAAGDPVGNGLVSSLSRPGGNVTGLSLQQTDTGAKRLELLRDAVPGLHRLAVIGNVGSDGAMSDMRESEAAGRMQGLEVLALRVSRPEDLAQRVLDLKGRADALIVVTDPLIFTAWKQIHSAAQSARLPTICSYREYVEGGCLMSYGPSFSDMWRRAADFVDKILRGTKPSEIPVEQPPRFDLGFNLKTARALNLKIPQPLLLRADFTIE